MAWRILPALAALLGACYGPSTPIGVPCAANNECPSGQSCNPETNKCEPPSEPEIWRDDAAADFEVEGALADGTAVEAAGFVGPIGYFAGGLRITGIDRNAIPDRATTWSEVAAAARAGTTFVRSAELDFGTGTPLGLGLSSSNDITVLVEGEIYLGQPGTWRFELAADDLGFVDLAPPGGSFQRVVTDEDVTSTGDYVVTAPGWHRLRGAFADGSGSMAYELRYDPPGGPTNFREISQFDLRAPAGDVAGLIVDGFEGAFLMGPRGSVLHPGTLASQTFETDPFGLPLGTSSYALRFAGQVRIDVAGSYAFRVDSGQGHRVWIDGTLVTDKLGILAESTVTPPAELEPGWHDFVVDMHRYSAASARLAVTVESGPAWVGETIPLENLRPVVGRRTRWAGAISPTSLGMADAGSATKTLNIVQPPGMTASRIDVTFAFTHPVQSSMQVRVTPPVGSTITPVAAGSLNGTGSYFRYLTMPPSTAGATWNIIGTDTVTDNMTGSLTSAGVTIHGFADPAPFPTTYRFVSAPRDLGKVASFSHVRWALRQPRSDATATISLRTCDDAAACDAEPWTPVAEGPLPDLPARRFAQYMVELTSSGDVPTALDWIEIGYRAYVDR
ncbi:MAG TPA: PA14 domain-containing protein [Kofleriaceae bacterium]|nr:PA14 domain-containing protein [Kofleriaceae bacterium]